MVYFSAFENAGQRRSLWHCPFCSAKINIQEILKVLFRPIRLLLLLGIAFVVGILYERNEAKIKCVAHGGKIFDGMCEK